DAGGRTGWNVVIDRTYRSRTLGGTDFGMGWDSSIFRHLRALPNGSVEYHDGEGEIWQFTPASGGGYTAPVGLFLRLAKTDRGWMLIDQQWRIMEFDEYERLTSEADEFYDPTKPGSGNKIHYLYGADGRLATIIDPLGRATSVAYYAEGDTSPGAFAGYVKEISDWRGRQASYLYDSAGRLTEVRLPAVVNTSGVPRPTIKYGYHAGATTYNDILELGTNLVSITDPNEVATGGPPRLRVTYGTSGNDRDKVLREDWPTGEFGTFTYTSPTQVETKDVLGQVRSYTLAGTGRDAKILALVERQVPTSTTPVGQLPASVTATTVPASPQDRTWTFEYDAMRLKKRTLLGVAATEYGYQAPIGAPGVVVTSATTTPIAASTGAMPIARTFTYQSGPNGSTFLQTVAANGLVIETPQPHRNKLETQATNNSVTSTQKFDTAGRLIEFTSIGGTDASGSGALLKIKYKPETAPFHARGELEEITRGDQSTKLDYPTPDRTVVTDPRGVVTTTDYDAWRRPVHITVAGPGLSTEERLHYDATGSLVRHERKQGADTITTTFEFDAVGRLKRETSDQHAVNGVATSLTTTTAYDLSNRKIITTLPSGATITRELDGLGRTTREVTATGASPIESRYAYDLAGNQVYESDLLVASAAAFDGHGREIATLHADGTRATREFDAWGRATNVKTFNDSGSTLLSEQTQAFTPAGRLQSASTKIDPATSRVMDIQWDGSNRTTGMSVSGRATRTSFDASGRVTSFTAGAGSAASITTPFVANSFLSHSGGLPVQITSSERSAPPLSIMRQYDAAGNVTLQDVGALEWRQSFDEDGNLTTLALPQRPASTFEYDGHGALAKETLPDGAVNQFEYRPSGALAKYLDPVSEPTTVETDLVGRPVKRIYADGTVEQLAFDGSRLISFTDR
ncbi:MAG: RHS repeat domain-containing protein, partial [Thermoanaerobaculia bacterium]